jgi:hypothetical protein
MNDNEDIESTKTSPVETVPEKGSPLTVRDRPDGADERARDHNPLAPPINIDPGS